MSLAREQNPLAVFSLAEALSSGSAGPAWAGAFISCPLAVAPQVSFNSDNWSSRNTEGSSETGPSQVLWKCSGFWIALVSPMWPQRQPI